MGGVEGDAGDATLVGFRRMIFAIANDRMADGEKLRPDLILQSGEQRDPDQRSGAQAAFHAVAELSPGGLRVALRGQFLEHSLAAKIVNQSSFRRGQMAANDREILADGSVLEKLADQEIAISLCFGEEQNAGSETIDAMDHEGSLPTGMQVRGEHGKRRREGQAFDGDGGEAGGLVDGHDGVIFIKNGEARRAPPRIPGC